MLEGRFCVFESVHTLLSGQSLEKIKGQALVGFPSPSPRGTEPVWPPQVSLYGFWLIETLWANHWWIDDSLKEKRFQSRMSSWVFYQRISQSSVKETPPVKKSSIKVFTCKTFQQIIRLEIPVTSQQHVVSLWQHIHVSPCNMSCCLTFDTVTFCQSPVCSSWRANRMRVRSQFSFYPGPAAPAALTQA